MLGLYQRLLIRSPPEGCLCCFQIFAITENAATNVLLHVLVCVLLCTLL